MANSKSVDPKALRQAFEAFLNDRGSGPILLEELSGPWLEQLLNAPPPLALPELQPDAEPTQVAESSPDEIDLGAMVSDVLEPSLLESLEEGEGAPPDGMTAKEKGPAPAGVDRALFAGGSGGGDGILHSQGPDGGGRLDSSSLRGRSHSMLTGSERGSLPDPDVAPPDDVVPRTWGRYRIVRELAKGGQGRILEALDENIGRPLALKVLQRKGLSDARQVRKFYDEAQITGQMEHPIIVPVHELGRLENGLPYYTMKKVEGVTLKSVIIGLRKKNSQVSTQYSRAKLISILLQVCQAMSYAHDRGVIHRDLKPSNVMLGNYGEVTVLDWGVALLKAPRALSEEREPVQLVKLTRKEQSDDTLKGAIEGTPAYMAPEQAKGRVDTIDERTDVYALGAILYEILTYRPPFRGDVNDVLRRVPIEMPVRPSLLAPQNQIPEELELICMRCLSKHPDERYPSVRDLQADLESFMEGTKRRAEAAKKVEEALELVKKHQQLQKDLLMARVVARRAGEGIQGWEPIERKRGVWATWRRVEEIEARILTTFGEAVARFSQALGHDPDNRESREGLADLFVSQYRKAEAAGDVTEAVYCESMVRQHRVPRYDEFLAGDGWLTLNSDPMGAEVWFYRYEERDRVLRPVDARLIGLTPVSHVRLAQGSYLIVLRAAGFRDVYYPIKLRRQEEWEGSVKFYPQTQIGQGFIYIPGGQTHLGGDLEAIDTMEKEIKTVDDFAIAEYPVTFRDYLEFLNAWLAADPNEAAQFVPHLDDVTPLVVLGPNGYVPIPDLIGPEARAIGRPGMELDVPIFGVEFEYALSWCAWKTEVTGIEHRLPKEEEWEKAARGVDGRAFPWGNYFDPTFCKSRLSRPWSPEPEPIRSFPEDISPYGVRDMAGGVREWCDSWYNEAQGLRVLRGGAWVDTERFLRCASRSFHDPVLSKRVTGFRCARSLFRR